MGTKVICLAQLSVMGFLNDGDLYRLAEYSGSGYSIDEIIEIIGTGPKMKIVRTRI
jgi:hypothetical protein